MTPTTDTQSLLDQAETLLSEWTTKNNTPEPNRLDIWLAPDAIVPAIESLVKEHWGYLASITGLDHPDENTMEAIYHLCSDAAVIGLRVTIDRMAPVLPSICHLIPSATLLEREVVEMFGITFTDTPDTTHLYLPETWPEGVYPLRKDAKLD